MNGKEALLKLYIQVEPTNTNIDLTDIIEKDLNDYERLKWDYKNLLKQVDDFIESLGCKSKEEAKKKLEVLEIIKRFIKSNANDLFGWCEQYDEVNNTSISKLIKEWLGQ